MNEAVKKLIEADIEAFRDYLLSFGVWAPVVSFFLMIFTLIVAPLPAFVVTFSNGLLFGAFWGGVLSWTSAMVGAAICFFIARSLGRPVVEKLVSKTALHWTDLFFERYGMHSVLIARLIPVVSFALISYASGLTAIRFIVFVIATGIGQLPATILYSILGENANKSVLVVFWAFVVVICFGIVGAALKPRFEKKFKRSEVVK
ncbi:TVP38/TMEM64 family protein [Anaerobacillus alkalidiazotrophicus]|uniref:TVP38/TMEM64 family protein n=1 Tax=Anaerobacillus alkalidiazotrophicus TaxID=472963 RepID=UPI001FE02A9B|nr:TVP38/TMEM64 family protein [Anaerobacillus alkalidiazotrophicus]